VEILVEECVVDAAAWSQAVALETGLPFRPALDASAVDIRLIAELPMGWATRHALLPLAPAGDAVETAVADLTTVDTLTALEDLRVLLAQPIRPVLVPAPAIRAAIAQVYERAGTPAAEILDGLAAEPLDRVAAALHEPLDLEDTRTDAPVVRFVNALLAEALAARASDIHIEPFDRALSIRFRIDGLLHDVLSPPPHAHAAVISRLKIMTGLDIAERRLPQDGRMRVRVAGREVDVRLSAVPTIFGERMVLRLLDRTIAQLRLDELGLDDPGRVAVQALLARSHGMVLVTGPTGSGKTTTLYAALAHLAAQERQARNILTIEDPVEYQLRGVGQIQVNPRIDLSFACGLRSLLRQDPDVIMVGEIRDRETAEIAVHASLTGHIVLSTLHTTDAAGAVSRLLDMGIEPVLVASALSGVVAQRLLRRLCLSCRQPDVPWADAPMWVAGPGCDHCRGTGYHGRTGIFELLTIDDEIRRLILERADTAALRRRAVARGMTPLRDAGARSVAAGTTTVEELLRVMRDETT
jgi:general secretion pathway protein E